MVEQTTVLTRCLLWHNTMWNKIRSLIHRPEKINTCVLFCVNSAVRISLPVQLIGFQGVDGTMMVDVFRLWKTLAAYFPAGCYKEHAYCVIESTSYILPMLLYLLTNLTPAPDHGDTVIALQSKNGWQCPVHTTGSFIIIDNTPTIKLIPLVIDNAPAQL